MPDPLKPSIMNDFRESLGVNTSPSFFNEATPLTPVALVSGNVGFPKPRTNQKLHYTLVHNTGVAGPFQIASVTSTSKVYLVGVECVQFVAVANTATFYDDITGNGPGVGANTVYTDLNGYIASVPNVATIGSKTSFFPSLPIEVKRGIRVATGGAGVDVNIYVYWIEEDAVN